MSHGSVTGTRLGKWTDAWSCLILKVRIAAPRIRMPLGVQMKGLALVKACGLLSSLVLGREARVEAL